MTDKTNTAPAISIITVVYNGVQHIEQAILSVKNQHYPNLEYIVVDGGSTDGTLNILEKHKQFINHLVSEPDTGISDAFNKGIALATGEVIGILNADDQYFPNTLSSIAAAYSTEGVYYGNMQLLTNHQYGKIYI